MEQAYPNRAAFLKRLSWLGLATGIAVFGLLFLAIGIGMARAAAVCAAVDVVVIGKQQVKRSPWFWVAVVLVIGLEILVVSQVHWSSRNLTGYALVPAALLVYAAGEGVFALLRQKLVPAET